MKKINNISFIFLGIILLGFAVWSSTDSSVSSLKGIEDKQAHLDDREMKLKLTVHAEKNMIYNAVEHGVKLEGSTVYIWGLPTCEECWKGLVQVGVSRVVMPDIEFNGGKWKEGCKFAKEHMEKVGIDVTEYLMGFILLQD